jgi:hypothetical protein
MFNWFALKRATKPSGSVTDFAQNPKWQQADPFPLSQPSGISDHGARVSSMCIRDADDDMVLEAAANGRADAIATFNTRDFAGVASEFGIAVLTPAEILRRL